MKSKFFIALVYISLIQSACTKNDNVNPLSQSFEKNLPAKGAGGEDDDVPILMEKVVDVNNQPVSNTYIKLVKGTDTIVGITNSDGISIIRLSAFGNWGLHIAHVGYTSVNYFISISDSLTQKVDTLIQ